MTKRYNRTDLYYIWVNHSFDLPDDYVVPMTGDGDVDMEAFDADMWQNAELVALDEDAWRNTLEGFQAVPGYLEHSMEDSGQSAEVVDTDDDKWPWG